MDSPLRSFGEIPESLSSMVHNECMSFTSTPSVDSNAPLDSVTPEISRLPSGQVTEQYKTAPSSYSMLGQFSFAPATQTTVVTTTTTTTTSFPPLMMKSTQHLHELDSKLYPLAALPTPQSIKRFCMDVGGRPIIFREADDTAAAIDNVRIYHF